MNVQKAEFIRSASEKKAFFHDGRHAVAFAGKSNVGKSSVINSLLNRKNFARVGATPGKTVQVNYFLVDGNYFIDLPGYGYARVSGDERRRWGVLMEDFFQDPSLFTAGVLIVDARHAPTADDVTMAEFFFDAGRPFVVVANKCDKLKKSELEPNLEQIRDILGLEDSFPLIPYSCTANLGRRELLGFIENNI